MYLVKLKFKNMQRGNNGKYSQIETHKTDANGKNIECKTIISTFKGQIDLLLFINRFC